jgi:hypothetical protein
MHIDYQYTTIALKNRLIIVFFCLAEIHESINTGIDFIYT